MVACSTRWVVLFGLGLAGSAAGHMCDDGARVTCLAVQSLLTEVQRGHGMGASGTPHCTLDNQKVYCLVKHDYHDCQDGYQPCCSDGSNPWHSHSSPAKSDDLTCGGNTASMVTGGNSPPLQVVLDDMDNTLNILNDEASEGSYAPCMQDAYNNQFHHDWGKNKGHVSFGFKFEAQRSGCYIVEEHHPGKSWTCAQYSPRSTPLVIEHDDGRLPQTYYINQAENGGQWNKVGSIMLSPKTGTKFIMRNSPGEECAASTCFWIADAIRLTWAGEQCSSATSPFQEQKQDKDMQATVSSIPTEFPQTTVADQSRPTNAVMQASPCSRDQHLGMLTLHVRKTDSHYHSHSLNRAHSHADITVMLRKHKDVLETSLAAHFGFISVQILTVTEAGRRLAEAGAVSIHFAGQGDGASLAAEGLEATLQKALSAANAGLTIMEAKVEWTPSQPSRTLSTMFLIGITLLFAGLLAAIGLIVCWLRKKAHKSKVVADKGQAITEGLGKTGEAHIVTEVPEPEKKLPEQISDNVSVGSTMSPANSSATMEEVDSCEDKNVESQSDNEVSIAVAIVRSCQ